MKQKFAIGVLFALLIASFCTSLHSYMLTERRATNDMDQALTLTMAEQHNDIISEDTIRTFNSHLQFEELRGRATIAVDTRQKRFTCYAQCSAATIFSLSDQRPASVLWSLALLWAAFCLYLRRSACTLSQPVATDEGIVYGGLTYSCEDGQFMTLTGETVRLTPMQQQLMELFFHAPSHRLSKTAICDALWPKKPDANETLYTLIRRLRPIIEQHSSLKIESDRGRSYQLTDSDIR